MVGIDYKYGGDSPSKSRTVVICTGKMNSWVIFVLIVGYATAQRFNPNPSPGQHIAILRQSSELNPDGSYQWSYETENGIAAQEQGRLGGGPEPGTDAQGSFQYTAPDGTPISVQYTANEGGFQPQGAHLPVAPPIPPAILRSLEYNAAHPEQEQPQRPRF
ncbi:Insect cuticle protein [Popillia japonica]|uniref:Insect cuticle protein n=1 Tax=Popillia japonica TaxID=7064 RepID=A0AAW1L6C9_POPJA